MIPPEFRRRNYELALDQARALDGGTGELALAALLAIPRGPARTIEAARLARWAAERCELVACIVPPDLEGDARENWIDAHAELMVALAELRGDA